MSICEKLDEILAGTGFKSFCDDGLYFASRSDVRVGCESVYLGSCELNAIDSAKDLWDLEN